jgi:hypothetical protein
MDVHEPVSKRQEEERRAEEPTLFQYDDLPINFRQQVIYIWRDAAGYYIVPPNSPYPNLRARRQAIPMNDFWDTVEKNLAEEYGVSHLGRGGPNKFQRCEDHLLNEGTEKALAIIELTFKLIQEKLSHLNIGQRQDRLIKLAPREAIDKLNHRFSQHGIGYRFEEGSIIRVDSDYIHREVVRPVISLLTEKRFRGPMEEFLTANMSYRKGEYKDAINWAEKAFESTLKVICGKRELEPNGQATASQLIEVMVEQGLVPRYFSSVLKSGLPQVRNKTSAAHGQGGQVVTIEAHVAAYAIHLAAANILLSISADKQACAG